jgi:hypothetical protein
MSRVISFRDLISTVPWLKGYTEIELLDLGMDSEVNRALSELGYNINAAILYVPSKHRDRAGKVGVGYTAIGDIDPYNREFLNSRVCLPIERLIAASQTDMSLCKELAKLMGTTTADLRDTAIMDTAVYEEQPTTEYLEDDAEQVESEILNLCEIRDRIRGNKFNEHGALKTPREYAADLKAILG